MIRKIHLKKWVASLLRMIKHQGSGDSAIKNGEVSQKEKDKYCMILKYHTSIILYLQEESHNKRIQMNSFTKPKQTHRLREQTYG